MPPLTEDQNEIKQYLLGTLPEEAQQRMEKRLLTEADFLEELLSGEDELTDLYINEALSDEDRDRFERHFLSTPERHQKLRFARALSSFIYRNSEDAVAESVEKPLSPERASPTKSTWIERFRAFWNNQSWGLRPIAALLVIAIIAGTLWLFFRPRAPSPQTFATLALTISVNNRGDGVQATKVKLPLPASALKISLTLPERASTAAHYRVELENDSGETKPVEIIGQDAQSVSVVLPAEQLTRGQYALKLFTVKADGTEQRIPGNYFFTVE